MDVLRRVVAYGDPCGRNIAGSVYKGHKFIFFHQRGLALGVGLTGIGVFGIFGPVYATWLIGKYGWRGGYLGLAALIVVFAIPSALLWLREAPIELRSHAGHAPSWGPTFPEAARTYRFWAMGVASFFVATAISGIVPSIQPLLNDRGFSPTQAAVTAGAVGLALVIGRLGAGALLDRFWAPAVTCLFLLGPIAASILFTDHDITQARALSAAALLGLAMGAEFDVIAFLTSRYFGTRRYGAIFGVQFGFYSLGYVFAPPLFGFAHDRFGNYDLALHGAAIALVCGALTLLTMGRYPHAEVAPATA